MFNYAKKLLSLLLVLSLLLALPVTALAAEEDEKTVSISTAEDLMALSESCKLDTWSEGVTVELEADVSLEGVAFSPIASFGGTFHGNGHTISGLSLSEGLSLAGLFQRVQKDALIEDLNVSGTVKASSTCEAAGGLAGRNAGTIENCSFSGNIAGSSTTGGLVGQNTADGLIRNSSSNGAVTGTKMTGGVAGENRGKIVSYRPITPTESKILQPAEQTLLERC